MWYFLQTWPSTKLTCFPQRMETYSCTERKSYLPERCLFASSPVRSLRLVTWLRRALINKAQHTLGSSDRERGRQSLKRIPPSPTSLRLWLGRQCLEVGLLTELCQILFCQTGHFHCGIADNTVLGMVRAIFRVAPRSILLMAVLSCKTNAFLKPFLTSYCVMIIAAAAFALL